MKATDDLPPRLITAAAAKRYLGGARPETFGVECVKGPTRQRLYDRAAIDRALDRASGIEPPAEQAAKAEEAALIRDWLGPTEGE